MRPPAHVTSLDLLCDWQSAISTFRTDAQDALTSAALDVRRAFEWLEEHKRGWTRAVRDRHDEVTQAKAALTRKQWVLPGQRQPDITEEVKSLRRAQHRLAEAEDKVERTRRWNIALQKAVEEYEGPIRRLADLLEGDLPKAAALVHRLIVDLENYLALTTAKTNPIPAATLNVSAPSEKSP